MRGRARSLGPRRLRGAWALVGLWAAVAVGTAAAAPTERFALVIGVNDPGRGGLAPLKFADDDAVQNHALFAAVRGDTALLVDADAETRKLHRRAMAQASPPTRQAVLAAVERLFSRIRAAKAQGARAEFYFLFSGHGRVDGRSEGQLELSDAPLTRRELYDEVLARSPADINHVIIDACDSYFVVNNRGDALGEVLRTRAAEFLARDSLDRFPNTGALLSTSGAAESYEWSAIRAGVFSHLLRSALLGAADVNGDGRVTYAESRAFFGNAVAKLTHARAALVVHARPPAQNLDEVLFDARALGGATLVVDAPLAGRMSVEDDRGIRYADFHKSAERELRIALLPGGQYFVNTPAGEYAVAPRGEVRLASLQPGATRLTARGALEDALAKDLLSVPFGPAFYEGWRTRELLEADVDLSRRRHAPRPLRQAALWTGVVAATTAAVGAGFSIAADASYARYQTAQNATELALAQSQTRSRERGANIAFGGAATLGATALALWVADLLSGDAP